ncbi:MAG: SusC/RagA family TonB-linked outer membrane protein [Alistipes sp.]|jgi:TonB-linked SusC/RagA family outer membrane protein|nr:SusC/RagA family TonB-linked outer membrane protein [Alistipes sp.]
MNLLYSKKTILTIASLFCALFTLSAQTQSVSGVISDETGNPMPGIGIMLKGTDRFTIADMSGAYSISVPDANSVLEISFLGYITQEITVGNRTTINVQMQPDLTGIEEVVVIGYGTMQKRQVTSSITSLSNDDLPVGVGGSSIATQLQGKVAGLVISGTADPNSDNTFQLRGMASMESNPQPLIVIDGMPGGDVRTLSPEEIQSIDVLKDASAGAIYGTRATGGVILITTKKATPGQVRMTYTGEMMLKTSFGGPDLLNAEDYMKIKAGVKTDYGSDTDWWNAGLVNNPISHRHVVTLQGGVDNARVFANLSYDKNMGTLRGSDRTDYAGRLNADFKVMDGWLDVSTRVSYRQADRDKNTPNRESLMRTNPTMAVYDPNSLTGWNIWVDPNTSYPDMNEVAEADLRVRKELHKWFRPDLSLKLNIKPIRGLSYQMTAAYENHTEELREFDSANTRTEQQQFRKGRAKLEFKKTELLNTDGYFSYINDFNLHTINAVAGYSYFERNGEHFDATNYDFTNDRVGVWNLGEGSWLVSKDHNAGMGSGKDITQRLMAYFGRANWSYADKYMASASVRHEGSSKFAINKRWGTFWAVSGGWRISRENFMSEVSWIDDLKLRAGYGVTGNEFKEADYAARMFGSDTRWMMPDGTWAYSYGASRNINDELGWEEKREWNVGLDFAVLNNRIWGSFDIYRRGIHGMIYNVDVPQPPNTESSMYKNIGTMSNRGWEFVLSGEIVSNKDWNYTTTLNLSHNKSFIGKLWGENKYHNGEGHLWVDWIHRVEEGTEIGSFHVYRYAGLDETGKIQIYGQDGNIKLGSAGNQADRVYTHNYNPALIAGWSHNVSWKNLSLDFTLTSWIDFDIYRAFEMYYGLRDVAQGNMTYDAIDKNGAITGSPVATDYFLSDGTFVKLQNLTLGYTIPLAKYNSVIQSVKVYFTGHNLARWTRYDGLNPEQDVTGWDKGRERTEDIYPQTRMFTFGAQLNF